MSNGEVIYITEHARDRWNLRLKLPLSALQKCLDESVIVPENVRVELAKNSHSKGNKLLTVCGVTIYRRYKTKELDVIFVLSSDRRVVTVLLTPNNVKNLDTEDVVELTASEKALAKLNASQRKAYFKSQEKWAAIRDNE